MNTTKKGWFVRGVMFAALAAGTAAGASSAPSLSARAAHQATAAAPCPPGTAPCYCGNGGTYWCTTVSNCVRVCGH